MTSKINQKKMRIHDDIIVLQDFLKIVSAKPESGETVADVKRQIDELKARLDGPQCIR